MTTRNIMTTQVCARCVMQEGIVVAIDYFGESRRSLDYVPKPDELVAEVLPNGQVNIPNAYGGADDFWDFMEQELKPAIEQRFSIDKQRQTIFGHSLGGLWILHALLTKPTTFNTYVISSPSMWFSGGYIFKEVDQFIHHPPKLTTPINVLLSVGGDEQSLIPIERKLPLGKQKMLIKHRQNRKMIDSATQLFNQMHQANIANLQLNYVIYPHQTHKTAQFVALQDGMQVGLANRHMSTNTFP